MIKPPRSKRKCTIEGCGKEHDARGLCAMHRMRKVKTGTTDDPPPPPTELERFWAKVDKTDTCWLWNAGLIKGYGEFRDSTKNTMVYAHRYAYELLVGPIPEGQVLDHQWTCPKRCVNPAHLRVVTQKQNLENHSGARRDSKTGVRGVRFTERLGRYQAEVKHRGQRHYLGLFDSIQDAETAVVAKRIELFTHNDMDRERVATS